MKSLGIKSLFGNRSLGESLSIFAKRFWLKNWQIVVAIVVVTGSFIYGWYFDRTLPQSGNGMADQTLYRGILEQFKNGNLPLRGQLHYTIGYSILGLLPSFVVPRDPFVIVSYFLLLGTTVFAFLSVKKILGGYWALAFSLLLAYWPGSARSLVFVPEVFAIPWNNQVLIFCFAYFFWLLTTRSSSPASWRLVLISSFIAGYTFLVREESILFVLPLMSSFLYLTKANPRKWLVTGIVIILCFTPQLLIKQHVLGSITSSGRITKRGGTLGYSQIKDRYLQPELMSRNVKQTIIDSGGVGNRLSLLQAAPWLMLGFTGSIIIIFSKRYPSGLKLFILVSAGLGVFYLSGDNMSAVKLQFHCLRYISPALLALNLGVIVSIREFAVLAEKKSKLLNSRLIR